MKYLPYILIAILCCLVTYCSTEYFRLPCPEIVKSDTVTLIDTVFLQEDVIKKPYTPAISGIIYKDSVKSADSIIKIPAAYIYKDSLIDENLGIYITDTTAGKILGRGIRYNLKVPLKITETKTITNTIEKKVPAAGLFVGLEAGLPLRIAPEVEYISKKGMAYSYNYDLINRSHSLGFKKRIF
jgi:hypothetical protein